MRFGFSGRSGHPKGRLSIQGVEIHQADKIKYFHQVIQNGDEIDEDISHCSRTGRLNGGKLWEYFVINRYIYI